jgi:hypothetical protein
MGAMLGDGKATGTDEKRDEGRFEERRVGERFGGAVLRRGLEAGCMPSREPGAAR